MVQVLKLLALATELSRSGRGIKTIEGTEKPFQYCNTMKSLSVIAAEIRIGGEVPCDMEFPICSTYSQKPTNSTNWNFTDHKKLLMF